MEASTSIPFSSSSSCPFAAFGSCSNSSPTAPWKSVQIKMRSSPPPGVFIFSSPSRTHARLQAVVAAAERRTDASPPLTSGSPTKLDRSGRLCSPRAAREFSLLIAYAACLEGSDPVRLFDRRVNARRDPGYAFNKELLNHYDHMGFGDAPIEIGTEEEAQELMKKIDEDSATEAEVLSAPPKLVYNNFVLRFSRQILVAMVDGWNIHVLIIDKVIPQTWKDEPAGRILELCILHLAMAEIRTIGTKHQIVINEAVDLAKRFCDGSAPRIINGCLRTFVKDHHTTDAHTRASSESNVKLLETASSEIAVWSLK